METKSIKTVIIKSSLMLTALVLCAVAFLLFAKVETKAQTVEGKNFVHHVPDGYTGFALDDKNTWYYFQNGRIAWGWYGLAQGVDGQWYFSNGGYVDWNVTGLAYHYGGWFYVDHGKVNWGANTLCQNPYGWWKVTNGVVDFNFNGLWQYNGTWYYLRNGCIDWGYYGLVQGWNGKWYFVNGGYIDWNVTGLAYYYGNWYYVDRGFIRWNYNGHATLPGSGESVYVKNSVVVPGTGGLTKEVQQKADQVLETIDNDLMSAYNWSAHDLKYESYDWHKERGINYYANYGFTNKKGNCFVMASTMVALARRLGYESYQMAGAVPRRSGGYAAHSWAEIKYKGRFMIFDPDYALEMGNMNPITYGQPGTWRYSNWERMHD